MLDECINAKLVSICVGRKNGKLYTNYAVGDLHWLLF